MRGFTILCLILFIIGCIDRNVDFLVILPWVWFTVFVLWCVKQALSLFVTRDPEPERPTPIDPIRDARQRLNRRLSAIDSAGFDTLERLAARARAEREYREDIIKY